MNKMKKTKKRRHIRLAHLVLQVLVDDRSRGRRPVGKSFRDHFFAFLLQRLHQPGGLGGLAGAVDALEHDESPALHLRGRREKL